ncbi:MAG: hypothetical protein U0Q07_15060 [Acidimicrobiales bacterium]
MSDPADPIEPTADAPADPSAPGPDAAAVAGEPTAADEVASGPSGSKVGWIIGGVVAAVVVVVIVVVAVVARPAPTYSDATRQRFLAACTADGGADVQGPCGCLYDKLSATMPYDRFVDVDQQLKAQFPSTPQGQDLSLPPDVQAALEACRVTR